MINKLLNYVRSIIRMFNRTIIPKIEQEHSIAITNDMLNAIEKWEKMYKGKADWIDRKKGIVSLGLEKAICKEFANIVISEMETRVEGNDILDAHYQKAIRNLNKNIQNFLALGSGVIKPLGIDRGGSVEYVKASDIVPLRYDSNGRLIECAFIEKKEYNDQKCHYRCELHTIDETNKRLTIKNKAFDGNAQGIGAERPLSIEPDWANLPPEVSFPNVNSIDFGYYVNPIPNDIDESFAGMSIYSGAVEDIKKCDIQHARLDWEYESAERMVMADEMTLKPIQDPITHKVIAHVSPTGKERLFVGLNYESEKKAPDTYSPNIRDDNFIKGLNEYKRDVEENVGLAFGDLSKNESIEKTATEIKNSKQRKYQMVNQIQSNLKDTLEDLVKALAFYNGQYTTNYDFVCNFNDSILADEDAERSKDLRDVSVGAMSLVEYRMKWYGEDEETAKTKIQALDTDVKE